VNYTGILRVGVCTLVLSAICGLTACGGASDEARSLVETVGKLDSSVSVGINYTDYTAEVREAKAAIDNFRPQSRRDRDIEDELSKAVDFYLIAHEAWQADIDDTLHLMPEDYWANKYPDLEFTITRRPTADMVRQEAWARAAEHVEAARELQ